MIDKVNSGLNFQGGFRFRKMPQAAKSELDEVIKKGKQVFDNFEKKGDLFLVTRSNHDYRILDFIKRHNLKFEYYKDIDTTCGLDSEMPEALTKLLKESKDKPITNVNGFEAYMLGKYIHHVKDNPMKQSALKYVKKAETNLNEKLEVILKPLCINVGEKNVSVKKSVTVIDDREFARKVYIAPKKSEQGNYLVMVRSDYMSVPTERYAISEDGKIVSRFRTPEQLRRFRESFSELCSQ